MSCIDCMAAGLAPQPRTQPAMGGGRTHGRPSHFSTRAAVLLVLAVGLPHTGFVSSARAQIRAVAATTPSAAPTPSPARVSTGLVTIESDQQRADQLTGVITATGNVRIVYPDQQVVATSRQAQYFSREGRVVLSGDVDIVQEGGNLLRAEQLIYLVDSERMIAIPSRGHQVFSQFRMPSSEQGTGSQPSSAIRPVQSLKP